MLEKAKQKIKSEMESNKNNSYIQVVGEFLLQELDANPTAADKILQDGKTIVKSLDDMKNAASKKKVGNCAVLTDQEGFGVVLKYYGINESIQENKPETHVSYEAPKPVDYKQDLFDIKLEDLL